MVKYYCDICGKEIPNKEYDSLKNKYCIPTYESLFNIVANGEIVGNSSEVLGKSNIVMCCKCAKNVAQYISNLILSSSISNEDKDNTQMKCPCYHDGNCWGTKDAEECNCNNNKSNCDFGYYDSNGEPINK